MRNGFGCYLTRNKGLIISANTGSNLGICSSSGGFNVCAGFFFADDVVFDEDALG